MDDKIRQRDHHQGGFEGLLVDVDDEVVLGWEPELETSEIFFLEILELDAVLGWIDYRKVETIGLEKGYDPHESLDPVSKDVDQFLGRDSPLLAIGPLLGSDPLPHTRPHLRRPSIPDVLSSSHQTPKGDLD